MKVKLNDIRSIRRALGRSQSEMAAMLGVSTRAVQSYEQGWRVTPLHVQKVAALLLFMDWRKRNGAPSPCWQTMGCDDAHRACCPAYQFQAGDLCWLVNGTRCGTEKSSAWPHKVARCQKCPVTASMLTH